jgi:putative endonuclease
LNDLRMQSNADNLKNERAARPCWIVYIVRCSDRTLYTGITTDVDERVKRHNARKGAKYTRARTPVVLVRTELMESESAARKREAQIKSWPRIKKESLIKCGDSEA